MHCQRRSCLVFVSSYENQAKPRSWAFWLAEQRKPNKDTFLGFTWFGQSKCSITGFFVFSLGLIELTFLIGQDYMSVWCTHGGEKTKKYLFAYFDAKNGGLGAGWKLRRPWGIGRAAVMYETGPSGPFLPFSLTWIKPRKPSVFSVTDKLPLQLQRQFFCGSRPVVRLWGLRSPPIAELPSLSLRCRGR